MKITTIFALVLSISASWPQQAAPLDQIRRDLIAQHHPSNIPLTDDFNPYMQIPPLRPDPIIPVFVIPSGSSANRFSAAIRTSLLESKRYNVTLDPSKNAIRVIVVHAATIGEGKNTSEAFVCFITYDHPFFYISKHFAQNHDYKTPAQQFLGNLDNAITDQLRTAAQ